jgi:hypothetical protein
MTTHRDIQRRCCVCGWCLPSNSQEELINKGYGIRKLFVWSSLTRGNINLHIWRTEVLKCEVGVYKMIIAVGV